ncbi:MAG: hypothetical protein L0H09_04155, partial [Psychrobacter sp.]|nr:hypothetical protein [Psychrobacter sp.]
NRPYLRERTNLLVPKINMTSANRLRRHYQNGNGNKVQHFREIGVQIQSLPVPDKCKQPFSLYL